MTLRERLVFFTTPRGHRVVLIGISVCMFVFYNILNFHSTYVNSPDEMVNREFIRNLVAHHTLTIIPNDSYGTLAEFVHPRSTYVRGTAIVPVGFWGLTVLYGGVGMVIGVARTVYLTSLLSIGALWALYFLWRRIFTPNMALRSAALFALHPAVWYYCARSLFPNMPVLALGAIGAALILLRPFNTKNKNIWWLDDVIGMIVLGCAVLIRPVEALWWAGIALIVGIAWRKQCVLKRLGIWILGAAVTAGVFVGANRWLYGDAIGTYVSSDSLPVQGWYSYILPFGFHPRVILQHLYIYEWRLLWWLVVPMLIGFGWCVFLWTKRGQVSREQKVYTLVTLWVGVWLALYYGSSVDTTAVQGTIGVSYVRYFIPVFVLGIPYMPWLWQRICVRTRSRFCTRAHFLYVLLVIILSVQVTLGGVDGLLAQRAYANHADAFKTSILDITRPRDILITDTEDKFIWPDRQVMVKTRHPDILRATSAMITEGRNVYYLTPAVSEPDQHVVIDAAWAPYGIALGPMVISIPPHQLYQVILVP